ncbi:SET domain-containing protein [Encephalitozoon romaleae SJ-2008]|uniref:SET domain-containing protein n=1 Tax=Encephalitozoon romaleae (strain SJ-2008) TaxID=1178016 RepID=I6ZVM4_ENCRO|nr:SET domain-containing protein [Encephalitozoon romaleae SJ-2008]AFN83791.1 SET domain-containing protein [Encephalitozoon romaleae SJ-2008]
MGSENGINKSLNKIVPIWMSRLYKDPALGYKKKMRRVMEKKENPSDLATKRHSDSSDFQPSVEKIVIPRIEPDIRSAFFTFTNISIKTEDDPVLRFVPCIPGAFGLINLAEFKEIGLLEKQWPCSKKTEEGAFYNSFDAVDGLRHNEKYSKGGELLEMRRLFCNVCFIFGCKWHSRTKGVCIKPVGFESNPSGSKSESKEVCGEVCKKMKRLHKSITKNDIDQSTYSVLYRDCWMSQGYGCIASLLFYLRHRKYIPCEEIKESCAALVGRHKYVIGNNNRGNIDPSAFFTPCDHPGDCVENNGCICASNRTNCEMSCLCVGCKNFFMGCMCPVACDDKCACRRAMRECIQICSCSLCGNKDLQMGNAEPTFVAPSGVEGYGLFAKEKISRGKFVIEYVGEIISNEEAERRGAFYDLRGCSYLFDLYNRGGIPLYVVDSRFIGNRSRFINHSKKNPNLNVSILLVNGIRRIGFYASRDIDKNEELFFDYGYSEEHKKKHGIVD